MKHSEFILAVRNSVLPEPVNGLISFVGNEEAIHNNLIIAQRRELEDNTDYRQLIPCAVMINPEGKIWAYRRAGGEERLNGKVSIMVGGHVDLHDVRSFNSVIDLRATLYNGLDRELAEEVNVQCGPDRKLNYEKLICLTDTPVSSMHLGIIIQVNAQSVEVNEDQLVDLGWFTPEELLNDEDIQLEGWAKKYLEDIH